MAQWSVPMAQQHLGGRENGILKGKRRWKKSLQKKYRNEMIKDYKTMKIEKYRNYVYIITYMIKYTELKNQKKL